MTPSKNREIEMGALDTETGGLIPAENGLISIAIAPPKHLTELKPLYVLLEYNDNLKYDHKALEVNGFCPIQDKETKEFFWWQSINGKRKCIKGLPEEEGLDTVLTYLEVYLKNAFVVGCNINFDKNFLLEACKRIDKKNEKQYNEVNYKTKKQPQKSFQSRLDKCLLRKTIELQTLALCAHIQNQITLPYTSKPDNSKGISNDNSEQPKSKESKESKDQISEEGAKKRPSLSLNSIAKAISERSILKLEGNNPAPTEIKRKLSHHDALEDAMLTLKLAQELTEPWEISPIQLQPSKQKAKNDKNCKANKTQETHDI